MTMLLGSLLWMMLGCQPPPGGEPSVTFVFPQSRDDIVVCPQFVVSVDIDNFSVVDVDPALEDEAGEGHWHLAGDGIYEVVTDSFIELDLQGDFSTDPVLTSITAHLAFHNHNELNTAEFPDALATAEFLVADTTDCVGDGRAEDDTSE
ncbi:MAG: hypothetical protein AAFV53_16885 [Myxococcota bacterium]